MSRTEDDYITEQIANAGKIEAAANSSVPKYVRPRPATPKFTGIFDTPRLPSKTTGVHPYLRMFSTDDINQSGAALSEAARVVADLMTAPSTSTTTRARCREWIDGAGVQRTALNLLTTVETIEVSALRTAAQSGTMLLQLLLDGNAKALASQRRAANAAMVGLSRVVDLLARPAGQSITELNRPLARSAPPADRG